MLINETKVIAIMVVYCTEMLTFHACESKKYIIYSPVTVIIIMYHVLCKMSLIFS